jgi:hypothetical protein
MMQEQKKTVGLNTGTAGQGRPKKGGVSETPPKKDDRLTLAEAGIERRAATKNNENHSVCDRFPIAYFLLERPYPDWVSS